MELRANIPTAGSPARLVDICSRLVDDLQSRPRQAGAESRGRKGREREEVDGNYGKREIDYRKEDSGGTRRAGEKHKP